MMENPFKKKTIKLEEESIPRGLDANLKQEEKDPLHENEITKILDKLNYSDKINKILKTVIAAEIIIGGVAIGNEAYTKIKETKKQEIEAIDEAKSYSIEDDIKNQDLSRFFVDDFISEVALTMKGENEESLIKNKEVLLSVYNSKDESQIPLAKSDSLSFLKEIDQIKLDVDKEKKKLTIEDKKNAKEKIIEILALVEQAKLELIKHIQSDEYLNNLGKEIDISEKAAKEHQKTRISNIKNLSLEFKTSSGIGMDTNGFGYAYYRRDLNKIFMPYNINLKNDYDKKEFYNALLHEILHESTQTSKGMSVKSMNVLEESFQQKDSTETKEKVSYYSNPVELIVRKQILDLEMEKLGIKKYGEVFTEDHYKKLKELRDKYELSSDAIQLIDHIKPEEFTKIMNELAENKGDGNTYRHPSWNYDQNEENKA